MTKHPYEWLSEKAQKKVFTGFLIVSILLFLCFQVIDAPLQTDEAPMGIVSLQLAGSLSEARIIIDSWDDEGLFNAGISLGIDYLFMLAYGVSVGLGCVFIGRKLSNKKKFMSAAGYTLSWGLIAAVAADVLENYALILTVSGADTEMWPVLSYWCASVKFLILALAFIYIIIGAIMIPITAKR